MTFSRETSVGYQVNHLARLLANELRRRIEPHGVVPGQFAQLLALYEGDGVTQAELCEQVQIEQPTMASTLSRMERDGLIARNPDPADGRRALITLTPKARDLRPDVTAAAQSVNADATRGLTDAEVATFMTTLATIRSNLESVSRAR
jgi:DNA-binding MarR family transcriptional regulator